MSRKAKIARKGGKPRNIRDIAALAGVSYATVSRVINDKRDVKPATRERVTDIMTRHGFVPNYFARSLQRKRTGILGLVMSSGVEPTYAPILAVVDEAARARGDMLMVSHSHLDPAEERTALESLAHRGADGILLDPCLTQLDFLEEFDRRTPLVLFNKPLGKRLDAFFVDNRDAARRLCWALLPQAPRPLHLVTNQVEHEKRAGWEEAAREAGAGDLDCRCLLIPDAPQVQDFLALAAPPLRGTYVFTFRSLLGRVCALGRELTDGATLLPFDHVPEVEYRDPPLPSCIFPSRELAAAAIQRLYERIELLRAGRATVPRREMFQARLTGGAPP